MTSARLRPGVAARRSAVGMSPANFDTSTPAVVLKLDPNVMHHGGLGVIRSLGRLGVPVYGVHEGPWAPAANSVYLRGRCFWMPDPGKTDQILAGLSELAERIGRPAVLLPTDDAGAIFLAEHGAQLRSQFLFADPPPDLPRQVAGKYSLYQLCAALDVPGPRVLLPDSLAQAREFATDVGFPLIAKLTTPWAHTRGLRSTSVISDRGQLAASYQQCAEVGAGLMLQEFIPGGSGHDWFFHGYCDASSVCRPAFTGVKERSYPAHAGLTCFGRSVPSEQLRAQVTELLSRLGYRGILDLDLRLDARDGLFKLLDFNPRLGAQFRLFRDTAGLDVATAAYLDLTGQPIPAGEQVPGRGFLVENYDPLGALRYWRDGELGLMSWLASLRTVDETAWFARDDLRPFGLMCVRMGWRLATRPLAGDAGRPRRTDFRYRGGRAAGPSGAAAKTPAAAAKTPGAAAKPPAARRTETSRRTAPQSHQEGTAR
jgi:predicted ATP-grasp superfamily ATP-dependent carboligase